MRNFIQINGHTYPQPSIGLTLQTATMVDSARNSNGVVVGQVVGREVDKINNLQWKGLDAATWKNIQDEFNNFYFTLTYYSQKYNDFITRKFYPGDRTSRPLKLDSNGKVLIYEYCKVNLIDVGE